MHRRQFIATLAGAVGGASAFGPGSTSAQAAKVRRIGILMGSSESDTGDYFAAFVEELARSGKKFRPQKCAGIPPSGYCMRASAQGDVAEQLVLKREEQYLPSMVHTKVIYDRNDAVWNTEDMVKHYIVVKNQDTV
jgi:hypothetical protein